MRDSVVNAKPLTKRRSAKVSGHMTSVSLEDAFWNQLRAVAKRRGMKLGELISEIDRTRDNPNLSSALRVFVLQDALAQQSN